MFDFEEYTILIVVIVAIACGVIGAVTLWVIEKSMKTGAEKVIKER